MMSAAARQAMGGMERPMRPGREHGYAYLAVLLAITTLGVSLVATSTVWHEAGQREKEAELLFIGDQYRRAIQQYYESSPGPKTYPASLDSLLLDPRYPGTRRYLRRPYRDPMTSKTAWGQVMAPEGGIMGIHSLRSEAPLKRDGFSTQLYGLEHKNRYSDWVFSYRPRGG